MIRDLTDLRVDLVARAIDRALASPNNIAETVGSSLVELGDTCESLTGFEPEAIRAIVMAYALNAPDWWLKRMAKVAQRQLAFAEWWDAPGGGEHQGHCNGCSEVEHTGVQR